MEDEFPSLFSSPKDESASSFSSDKEQDYGVLKLQFTGETTNGQVKTAKRRSKGLEKLLEEASIYTPRYESSLPRGFLRDRHKKSTESKDPSYAKTGDEPVAKKSRAKLTTMKKQLHTKKRAGITIRNVIPKTTRPLPEDHRGQVEKDDPSSNQSHAFENSLKPTKFYFVECEGPPLKLRYDLFDVPFLQTHAKFQGSPTPSTILTAKSSQRNVNSYTIMLKSVLFLDYEEEYHVDSGSSSMKFDSMSEIGKIIEYTAIIYVPKPYSNLILENILPHLYEAFNTSNCKLFIEKVQDYNEFIQTIPREEILEHLTQARFIPRCFIHDLLHIVYSRSILPSFRKLKEYEAFSSYVYGELLPSFLSDVYSKCELEPNHVFMDLGSGVGNCVVQAALEYGCKLSFGCEIMPNASELTEEQHKELAERCKLFGLKLHPVEFSLRQSFVDNSRVDALIPQCDVLLINNFLFDAKLNKKVEEVIKSLKTGTKIISLKNLRGQGYAINFFNLDSILNRLKVERFDLKQGSVSWTHNGGEYYISTVLPDVDESLFDPSEGKRNTRRPQRYTR
ncbi:hypothetical protein HG535_0D05220 [Zygotorulaspora mrakii]|uniref:Histone-lysine N-methyltransferase, H3 lysine-79 specific n=1 Tax=Zygotorulaspora mrakii TaxID=42260 RepID=A0A7H9B2V3_ZYGMR|nr:uncharacterized protein HG535_0D05220 [Zygotorulaspora mrakii]QLG72813.1 hypothetical protein HG535_0D05220 [Zygotorulaspora mrakii]